MMVGEKVILNIKRTEPVHPQERLIVKNLSVKGAENKLVLDDVSFTVRSGGNIWYSRYFGDADRRNFWKLSQVFRRLCRIQA